MKKLVALLTLLAVLTACGGGDRPSTDDIAKALRDKGNPNGVALASGASDDAVDCIARVLHDSDLSDGALKALVDGKSDYQDDSGDAKAISAVTRDLGNCLTG